MEPLNTLFAQHIDELNARAKTIMVRENVTSLIIHSGQPHRQFLDDMDYPFKVNPHFKAWVPVTDNPNCWVIVDGVSKPTLVFYRPV
ncbi:MAG: Xaa-Pro dipeptidase, partial [Gammaproteobacteria bacterium MedPE]